MKKDLTLESLDKSLEQSKKAELEKQQQIEAESMSELAKSLRTSLQTELDLIEADITKMQEGIIANNKTLAENSEEFSEEVMQSLKEASQELTKLKAKQWIIPTVMGLAIVMGLAFGTWSLGAYATHQLQVIEDHKKTIIRLQEMIEKQNKIVDKYIKKSWNNAIGVMREPQVWRDSKENLWIVQFEKSKGE